MFNRKEDTLYWLTSADDSRQCHEEVRKDLKGLLHDYAMRSGWSPSQTGADANEPAQGEDATPSSDSGKQHRYSISDQDDRHHVHDECVARLLSAQREKDERKWHMRRAVCGHCLVDVKRCPAGPKAVKGGPDEDGSLLKRLQEQVRALGYAPLSSSSLCGSSHLINSLPRETACDSVARYPALQQGEENDKGSILLVREHLHAAVDLKILFKAHERKELQLPLYLRLQILWECAQALRSLHHTGLGHGDLTLSSIKVNTTYQLL
jgi:hypothetical protein